MKAVTAEHADSLESAASLPEAARSELRALLLTLADNKRLLGIRYSDWMLGAPTLETAIAASSMAQDEWGHGRLTYALLSDFGDDPKKLEHEREAAGYHSMEVLDRKLESWTEMIAAALLLDTALTVQYGALIDTRYTPLRNRVQKLLDEESFHFQYATGWTERLADSAARPALVESLARLLPVALRWLGGADGGESRRLREHGVIGEGAEALPARLLQCVGPVLQRAGLAEELGVRQTGAEWSYAGAIPMDGWNAARRRLGGGGPDADTLARVRGDKNRAALLD